MKLDLSPRPVVGRRVWRVPTCLAAVAAAGSLVLSSAAHAQQVTVV